MANGEITQINQGMVRINTTAVTAKTGTLVADENRLRRTFGHPPHLQQP